MDLSVDEAFASPCIPWSSSAEASAALAPGAPVWSVWLWYQGVVRVTVTTFSCRFRLVIDDKLQAVNSGHIERMVDWVENAIKMSNPSARNPEWCSLLCPP